MSRARRGSSVSTVSRATGVARPSSRADGSAATACSLPICSVTDRPRTSRPGASTEHVGRSSRAPSARSRPSGSATRSVGGSPSRSPPGTPTLVERLVLLDPAILIDPAVALLVAEDGRRDRSYASFEEGLERRFGESVLHAAPRELVEADLAASSSPTTPTVAGATATARLRSSPPTARWRAAAAVHATSRSRRCSYWDASSYVTVRPPARRASRGARRHARGRPCPRRPHGALGRTRGDRRGDRRVSAHLTSSVRGAPEPSSQTTYSSAIESTSSRTATPSSASSRVTVRGGTTMITFQCVIR